MPCYIHWFCFVLPAWYSTSLWLIQVHTHCAPCILSIEKMQDLSSIKFSPRLGSEENPCSNHASCIISCFCYVIGMIFSILLQSYLQRCWYLPARWSSQCCRHQGSPSPVLQVSEYWEKTKDQWNVYISLFYLSIWLLGITALCNGSQFFQPGEKTDIIFFLGVSPVTQMEQEFLNWSGRRTCCLAWYQLIWSWCLLRSCKGRVVSTVNSTTVFMVWYYNTSIRSWGIFGDWSVA